MNNPLKKFKASRSQRELRSLQRWEQTRAEGKGRFVFNTALTYGLMIVGVSDVLHYLFYGYTISVLESVFKVIFYVLAGTYFASNMWSRGEARYQKALTEARIKASPTGELPPHKSPLQFTIKTTPVIARDRKASH